MFCNQAAKTFALFSDLEFNGDHWNQSKREGESYAEFMDRLYRADPYANRKRDSVTGDIASSDGTERQVELSALTIWPKKLSNHEQT